MTNLLSQLPHRKISSHLDSERNWEFLRNGLEVDGDTIIIGNQVIQNIHIEDHTIGHDQLSFDAIDAMTITGTTIRTAAPPAARVEIDSLGIRGINASAIEKFNFDVTTGILEATGVISSETGSSIDTEHLAGQITETQIEDDSISTPKLQANSVTADEIDVDDLSAINADLGTITAGLVTGATFRTSSSSSRVQMDSTGLFYTGDGGTTKDTFLTTSGLKLLQDTVTKSSLSSTKSIAWQSSSSNRLLLANSSYGVGGESHSFFNTQATSTNVVETLIESTNASYTAFLQCWAQNSTATSFVWVSAGSIGGEVGKYLLKGDNTSDYLFNQETSYTAPSFNSTWANYGGGILAAGYRKVDQKTIRLRGTAKVGSSTISSGTKIFTLPAGYRPSGHSLHAAVGFKSGTGYFVVEVDILSTGDVIPYWSVGSLSTAGPDYVILDGITFDTI
jgi:hypothetical protein